MPSIVLYPLSEKRLGMRSMLIGESEYSLQDIVEWSGQTQYSQTALSTAFSSMDEIMYMSKNNIIVSFECTVTIYRGHRTVTMPAFY